MPSLRAWIYRHGLVTALRVLRQGAGGAPGPDASPVELEDYARAMRARVHELADRLPVPRGVHDLAVPGSPAGCRVVVHDRALAALGRGGEGADAARLLEARPVTLHVHGGGYFLGSPRTHLGLAAALSRASLGPVVLPDYRLAPEHRFPAALDDVTAVVRWLTDHRGVALDRVALSGDSAGGGLALAVLARRRDRGEPLPACYVGMSPWVDLSATGASIEALDGVDPWITGGMVRPAGRAYAGDVPPDHPEVSPLFADLAGLPPMLVQVGSHEVLLDDAVRLVARARAAGVDASLGRFDRLWHVFQAFPGLPEAEHAIREAGGFVRRHTAAVVPSGR